MNHVPLQKSAQITRESRAPGLAPKSRNKSRVIPVQAKRPGPTAGLRQTELVARLATSPGWTSDHGVEASSARTRGHSRVTVWYVLRRLALVVYALFSYSDYWLISDSVTV